jgi:PLP dependent protein
LKKMTAAKNLTDVIARCALAASKNKNNKTLKVRLVAVSKTKPVEQIQEVYELNHRVFGENYVQEVIEKAPKLPEDIEWHFVGHVQTNKAKALVHGVPNLTCVETVDSIKLADKLNVAVETCEMRQKRLKVLNVMVQVNTSGEESKYGVTPGDSVIDLAKHIAENCKQLKFVGLMTIGMPDYTSKPENFECLRNERAKVALALGYKDENELELSMGMSGDFESAIAMGSTNVRVGSTIFGARDYNK